MLTSPRPEKSSLHTYQADQIPDIWPFVRPHIARGLEDSDWVPSEVLESLLKSEMQLWTSENQGFIESAVVTAIQDGYCLLLCAGGGNLNHWKHYLVVIEEWAKDNGVDEIRIYGRRGWLRALPGFRERWVEMVKQL